MNAHILMHEEFEAPGAITDWCNKNNIIISYTRLYQDEKLPTDISNIDILFVMGGPQSPATTTEECPYFNAKEEINFIKQAIEEDKSILGICLGAQLVGEALGTPFEHSPNKEIGVYPIILTPKVNDDPVFSKFETSFEVGHWHGDMPGLTETSQILAYSEGCPRQIVRYSPKIYGFQCHFEFTPESIEGMIQNSEEELDTYKELPFVESPDELRSHDFSQMNSKLFNFLDYLKSTVK